MHTAQYIMYVFTPLPLPFRIEMRIPVIFTYSLLLVTRDIGIRY